MVHRVIVPDIETIEKLAEGLPKLTARLRDTERVYTPVFTTGGQQLLLAENGFPFIAYKVAEEVRGGPRAEGQASLAAILGYIDRVGSGKHFVSLYDDESLERQIEFRYIKNGLARKEQCMYVLATDDTETPASIGDKMLKFGIDTDLYLRKKLLQILKIPDPCTNVRGFTSGCQTILDELKSRSRPPVRMVLHVLRQFRSEPIIDAHMRFESKIQSSFEDFPGSMLCNHYIGGNDPVTHAKWTRHMLTSHDGAILAMSKGGSVNFGNA